MSNHFSDYHNYDFHHHKREVVDCEVEYCYDIEDEYGNLKKGVRVTCSRCGHSTESFGQSDKSIKRCCALLCETCPNDENNFYDAGI